MLEALAERGVDVSACRVAPGRPTGASVILSNGTDRAILTAIGHDRRRARRGRPAGAPRPCPARPRRQLLPPARPGRRAPRAVPRRPGGGRDDQPRPQLGSDGRLGRWLRRGGRRGRRAAAQRRRGLAADRARRRRRRPPVRSPRRSAAARGRSRSSAAPTGRSAIGTGRGGGAGRRHRRRRRRRDRCRATRSTRGSSRRGSTASRSRPRCGSGSPADRCPRARPAARTPSRRGPRPRRRCARMAAS